LSSLIFQSLTVSLCQSNCLALSCPAAEGECPGWAQSLPVETEPAPFMAFWATPTAPALSTRRGISIVKIAVLPARTNSHRDPLYDTPVVMARRIHAVVDGEVPTDQVRPHGRILTGKGLGFAHGICLVFAVVDTHNAGVSACTCVGLVLRFWPAAASTKTCFEWLLAAQNGRSSLMCRGWKETRRGSQGSTTNQNDAR
jgi:hypothetical protein